MSTTSDSWEIARGRWAREDRRRLVSALSWGTLTLVLCAVLVLLILSGGCAPNTFFPVDASYLQLIDPDARPTCPMVRLPHAGNPVFFAIDVPEAEKPGHLHAIDAWCQAYPIPGVRFYVFTYHGSPHSYRFQTAGDVGATIRLGRWVDPTTGKWIVGDLSWEIPRLFYGAADPPPLGNGPVNLPPDDAARRALVLQLAR